MSAIPLTDEELQYLQRTIADALKVVGMEHARFVMLTVDMKASAARAFVVENTGMQRDGIVDWLRLAANTLDTGIGIHDERTLPIKKPD